MEDQLTTLTSTAQEEPLCKGILRAISSLTPISEEQHQKLEGQYLFPIQNININLSILQKINLETNKNIVIDIDDTEIVEEVTKSTRK
ncbi:11367_t:CDS:2, partial [Scutellospora calospora]